MYITSLIIPVPAENIDAYRTWAQMSAAFFKEYGCLETVESWEDFIPDGKETDVRKAVAAPPGEKIVLTWQIWSDKETFEAAEHRMHGDPRMDSAGVVKEVETAVELELIQLQQLWHYLGLPD
jgi:uncharacterized protein YbaA (DUF1428 family)